VFLVLAALYESLTLPLVVILVVPLSMFSALFGVWITRGDNNIFTQIGLMVLVGLSAKNAILIVEFARETGDAGPHIVSAAVEASRLRLRPILMTSLRVHHGVIPLVLSSGAGAKCATPLDSGVLRMLGVTIFGLVLTPFLCGARTVTGGKHLVDKHGHAPHIRGVDEPLEHEESYDGEVIRNDGCLSAVAFLLLRGMLTGPTIQKTRHESAGSFQRGTILR